MDKENLEQITGELKKLITQASRSGASAWLAGEMLNEVKASAYKHKEQHGIFDNYTKIKFDKEKYGSFNNYTKKEFGITEQTANNYIKIRYSFKLEEIGDLLFSSLMAIADIENYNLRQQVVYAFVNNDDKAFRVKDVIETIALLDENRANVSVDDIYKTIKKVLEKSKKKKGDTNHLPKYGNKLYSKAMPYLNEILAYEPIDEMGTVALFCILFNEMKGKIFEFGWKNTLKFVTIKYIQVPFPDACIICENQNKKLTNTELQIEFEYESNNYIRHAHHKSKKECHLIICWIDNIRNGNNKEQSDVIRNLPPILELKDFLDTGEIRLRF